jgi:enolase
VTLSIKFEIFTYQEKAIHSVGDEGGFAPNVFNNVDAVELLLEAVQSTSFKFNQDVFIGIDIAANSFYQGGKYQIRDRAESYSAEEFIHYLVELKKQYNLLSIEDPLQEDGWSHWAAITSEIGQDTMIIGDDLLVTNKRRLEQSITQRACNSVLVKPNQIGTISETVQFIKLAKANHLNVIVSQRSGDTDEDFIADFAVGVGANYAKFGAPGRMERVAKYNRLSFIYDFLAAS